jgi:hypothetical protein
MTASLTPALALAYLRELSLDVWAAVALDADGAVLAGDEALAARARPLAAATPRGAAASEKDLLLARALDGRTIALLAGEFALLPLLEHDLRAAVAALSAAPAEPSGG